MKDIKIDNFVMFGAKRVLIELHRITVDDEIIYNPHITIVLDDGEEVSEFDDEKVVTLITDNFFKDPKFAAILTARSLSVSFDNIVSVVTVYDEENDEIDEFDLNEDFNEDDDEDSGVNILESISDNISVTNSKRVLH